MRRIFNFSAGPAILPVPVLEEASRGILEINGSGMSILEVSHRGKDYDAIHLEAMTNVLNVLGLSVADYTVLFMTGGASLQFSVLPMNLLSPGQTADYVDAGEWGNKALKDAKRFGTVHVAGSSAATKYDRLPTELSFSAPGVARYAHITTNNTIEGTQVFDLPDTNGAPLTADMSSDVFAVNHDFSRFSLFYFGTQKNAGAAGVTVVVARKDFLEGAKKDLPPMLSYLVQADKQSLFNTPPVFAVYLLNLVTKWVEAQGGVAAMDARNREKARIIYDALDAYPEVYRPAVAVKKDRSIMNVTFRLADESRNADFLKLAQEREMDGLPGHRNVGGFRASIYNAFPREGCVALAELLKDFAEKS
jgi:phosphoserine aminotransferase